MGQKEIRPLPLDKQTTRQLVTTLSRMGKRYERCFLPGEYSDLVDFAAWRVRSVSWPTPELRRAALEESLQSVKGETSEEVEHAIPFIEYVVHKAVRSYRRLPKVSPSTTDDPHSLLGKDDLFQPVGMLFALE